MIKGAEIAVIGGGIAGMSVAAALAGQGARVLLFEQAAAFKEVGAGLQLSPNGLRVLEQLGLSEQIAAQALRLQAVSLRRAESDRPVARLDLTRLPQQQAYRAVHRADLLDVLRAQAQASGVQMQLSHRIQAITPGTPAKLTGPDGQVQRFDLILDAGGLHGLGRAALNGPSAPFFTGQVAWRAVVPNQWQRPHEVHLHMAPGGHVVSYPLRGGDQMNIVAVQERRDWTRDGWSHADDPARVQAAFAGQSAALTDLLDAIETVHLWALYRHEVAQVWHGPGCALLGDAAHPTLPFLAQGANMALEDAWALAHFLARGGVARGLPNYQALRRARVARVIAASNGNAWRYHLRRGPLRFGAHCGLAAVSRMAPGALMRPFDWLYGYDIVEQAARVAL